MNELNELRKINVEFMRVSTNLLETKDEDNFLYVKRFYDYINKQNVIQRIISDVISNSEYNCDHFITRTKLGSKFQFNTPVNVSDHIKAIYNYLEKLALKQNSRLLGIAMNFEHLSGNFDEIVQNFLKKLFKPLIDLINDSLYKEMMILEHNVSSGFSQHIQNNYGVANVGENISSTYIVQQSDLKDIINLLSILKAEVENSTLNEDEKESVIDDLDVIKEQTESNVPKVSRLKKAINGVKKIIDKAMNGVILTNNFITHGNNLVEKVEQIIRSILEFN